MMRQRSFDRQHPVLRGEAVTLIDGAPIDLEGRPYHLRRRRF